MQGARSRLVVAAAKQSPALNAAGSQIRLTWYFNVLQAWGERERERAYNALANTTVIKMNFTGSSPHVQGPACDLLQSVVSFYGAMLQRHHRGALPMPGSIAW